MTNKWITDEEVRKLIERDEPLAMKKFTLSSGQTIGICANCEQAVIGAEFHFCPICGHRVLADVYKID